MTCLPNIRVCVFVSDPFRGHNILATRNSNEKKGLSNKQKGLIAQHTGEDSSQQQRDTQLQVVKESTTKFQHTTNRTHFFKQLRGIKVYERRSVSDNGY